MDVLTFTAIVWGSAVVAGFVGALSGLGGGVVIIPVLTLGLGVDIRYAAGAALISVIATSSGAASAYVRDGYSNLRVGMFLEMATTTGAVAGATLTSIVSANTIAVVFGLVLLASAAVSLRRTDPSTGEDARPDPLAARLHLDSTYPTADGPCAYRVRGVPAGFALMGVAGVLSGLLGIGSGAVKVLALDWAMRIPFKVSTTTSNFMIGVTAAASAGLYLRHGYIDPGLAMPVMLGVLAGSVAGAWVLVRIESRALRLLFTAVLSVLGVQMIYNGLSGRM